jgi:hypothetical protein
MIPTGHLFLALPALVTRAKLDLVRVLLRWPVER